MRPYSVITNLTTKAHNTEIISGQFHLQQTELLKTVKQRSDILIRVSEFSWHFSNNGVHFGKVHPT